LINPSPSFANFSSSGCVYYDETSPNNVANEYVLSSSNQGQMVLYFSQLDPDKTYRLKFGTSLYSEKSESLNGGALQRIEFNIPTLNQFQVQRPGLNTRLFEEELSLIEGDSAFSQVQLCDLGTINFTSQSATCEFTIFNDYASGEKCYANGENACIAQDQPLKVSTVVTQNGQPLDAGRLVIEATQNGDVKRIPSTVSAGGSEVTLDPPRDGTLDITARILYGGVGEGEVCVGKASVRIFPTCVNSQGELMCSDDTTPIIPERDDPIGESTFLLCQQILDTSLRAECEDCAKLEGSGDLQQGGVWTAVGCISRNPVHITERLIQVGLGMGGGVALIMTLAGSFILTTSQGDPQKANTAKEMITNSVIGLLFVIFSVVILQFIGVTILRIPGFGSDTEQVN
ncbi:MAG: hypothetical protein QG639_84, partial [Patescibacteria group bacterium]|nr:hypothetical protein [Patescibacteria group bacterium]